MTEKWVSSYRICTAGLQRRHFLKAGAFFASTVTSAAASPKLLPSLWLLLEDTPSDGQHVVGAKTVNPLLGNDNNDGVLSVDGGTGSWKTLEYALNQLVPGDTLELMFNFYQIPASASALKIDTDASSASIHVTRHPDYLPVIDCSKVTTPQVYRCDGMNNWRWSHIHFQRNLTVFDVGENRESKNNRFLNLVTRFSSNPANHSNVSFIRLNASSSCNGCDGTVVDRCSGDVFPGESNPKAHVFQCFRTHSYLVSNIYGRDIGQVVYHKHAVDAANSDLSKSIIVRNVLAENCLSAVEWRGANAVIQDVIGAGCPAIYIEPTQSNGPDVAANTDFLHLTSTTHGFAMQAMPVPQVNSVANTRFINCLFSDSVIIRDEFATTSGNFTDYNIYIDRNNAIFYGFNSTDYTLPAWQTFRDQDANSIVGNASFVAVDSNGIAPDLSGYALQAGSVGKGAASDGADIGARVGTFNLLNT